MGAVTDNNIKRKPSSAALFRKWSRLIHRDISYFFAGILIIYCISGIYMNHRDSMNVHYTIDRIEFENKEYPKDKKLSEAEVRA